MFIKVCGTTSSSDAELSARAGADALGVILRHPASPRHVELSRARELKARVSAPLVAVSVNQNLASLEQIADELAPLALQLHGDEAPALVRELSARGYAVWKVIAGVDLSDKARIYTEAGAAALVVDARQETARGTVYGGTGHIADWTAARALTEAGYKVILAGGLTPENVKSALEIVRPWGVDVVSGVEACKGVKDLAKVMAFVKSARDAANLLHL